MYNRCVAGWLGVHAPTGSDAALMAEDDEDRGGSRLEETKRVARIVEIATLLAAQPRRWTLALLERAWRERGGVRMVYERGMRGGARSEGVVEPYHLQRYGRFWILIAYDHLRQAVRDFKVDRLRTAVLLDERYTIPDDFDVATYRGTTWGLLRGEAGEPVDIELLFSPQAGRWVQEEDRGVPLSAEPRPDGSV